MRPAFTERAPCLQLRWTHVDLAQWAISALFDGCNMKSTDGPRPDEKELPLNPMRTEEALRIIEEYANELRAIIKKLCGRLN